MRHFLLITALIVNYCYAQENDVAVAKVHYMFKHINDTTQPENFLRDEVVTYIGQDGSYYTSYSSTRASEQMSALMNDPGFDGNLTIARNTSAINENYLFKPLDEKFQEVRKLMSDRYVLDIDFPEQDWTVEDETQEIGGYTCQKATTHFKGRDYTAWFTTELPFSYGPWKLHGLPGLILEAYDSKKEVVFEYNGFDKEFDAKPFSIGIPENAHHVTLAEFEKQKAAFEANPQAYIDARMGGSGTVVRQVPSSSGTATVVAGNSTVVRGGFSPSGSSGNTSIDPSKIKSVNIKNDDNYKPSQNTNNPIELVP